METHIQGGVEQYVSRLHVSMHCRGLGEVVQVAQALRCSQRNVHSPFERERWVAERGVRFGVQVVLETAFCRVLVHQNLLPLVGAVPNKTNQIRMRHVGNRFDLVRQATKQCHV